LRPTTTFDDFGAHILVCRKSGPLASIKTKHNTVVHDLAAVSNGCGLDGRYHDGPIFTFGPKCRPADLLQRHPYPNRFPEGECIDFTSGLTSVRSADQRETDKNLKYEAQLALHPHYGFRTFAVTDDGNIGTQANSLLVDWTRRLVSRMNALQHPPCDARGEVTIAVSRAFTRATISQFVHWLHESRPARAAGACLRL
jgi:hypothetical protein